MAESLPSDHPAVESYRVRLASVGSTNRPQLILPAALSCSVGEFVRLLVEDTQAHAEIVSTLGDETAIRDAYMNRKLARTGNGRDILGDWFEEQGYKPGTTLVLDVLTEGYAYGLREPGARVIYEVPRKPNTSLADIADSLETE